MAVKIEKITIFAVFIMLFVGAVFAQEQKTANPSIIPTIVIAPDTYYPLEKETLYVEGKAIPNAVVEISITQYGSKQIKFNVQADQNGDWVLTEKPKLEKGEYEIRARIEYEDGTTSRWSNPRIIKSVRSAFEIFGITIKYAWLAAVFFIGLIIALVFFIRFLIKTRGERENEIPHEIEEHLHREEMQHEKLERTLEGRIQELKSETAQKKSEENVAELKAKIGELERNLEIQKKLAEIEAQKKILPEPIQYSPIVAPTPSSLSKEEQDAVKKEFETKMKELEEWEKKKKEAIAKEADEAQKTVSEGFLELKRDFADQLKIIEEKSKYKPPSAEEVERKNQILSEMTRIESQIEELKESSGKTISELATVKKKLEEQMRGVEREREREREELRAANTGGKN